MGEVALMDAANGHVTTLVDVNPELKDFALGNLEPVKWHSFDGMEIWGLLLTPSDAPRGRPMPTLVYIHGGPGGGFTFGLFPQFMHIVPQVDPYPTAAMAGAGYAIRFRCRAAARGTARRASVPSSTAGAKPTTRTSWQASII
jgi:Dipeptidyl aminopeptidases/acylaminoacyl-peptidases